MRQFRVTSPLALAVLVLFLGVPALVAHAQVSTEDAFLTGL